MNKILILGSTGMMGSALSLFLRINKKFEILCTYKNNKKINFLKLKKNQKKKLDVNNLSELTNVIFKFKPNYVINCVGIIKQLLFKKNTNELKFLNTLLPKII